MLDEETADQANQAALNILEQVKARLANQNQALTAEQTDLNKELEKLESERQATLSPLDTSLLAVYDDLRQQKRGVAIVGSMRRLRYNPDSFADAKRPLDFSTVQLSHLRPHPIRELDIPMQFSLQAFSFIVGFITATVFWWLMGHMRPLWDP